MRRKEFTPGQLVWISSRVESWTNGMIQCKSGYPKSVRLTRGDPATIIRRALAKDFGIYGRHTHKGISTAATLAGEAWLVLYNGIPVMIEDAHLCKRRYVPKRKPKEV